MADRPENLLSDTSDLGQGDFLLPGNDYLTNISDRSLQLVALYDAFSRSIDPAAHYRMYYVSYRCTISY